MLTIFSDDHRHQDGRAELCDGKIVPCFEMPRRARMILERVRSQKLGPVEPPQDFGRTPVERVHAPALVEFLATAWDAWQAAGFSHDALPYTWPVRRLRELEPDAIEGRLGYWCFDAATPITAGTWKAAYAAAQVALTGAARLSAGERAVFALCRPPGHHAASDLYGGYCFLNNAAIAAQALRDAGAARVAVLDVDYHHGNGTQEIFYRRADVLFASLHADPRQEFPYFLGHVDERGEGPGEGFNLNYPMPQGTGFGKWMEALEEACRRIEAWRPDALVVSLGVDTFEGDPISHFKLASADFHTYGRRLAGLRLPTLFAMEGGYAVEAIGVNAVNVLQGFEAAG
ncbi:histone deacetylase family protein [Geminicoccaceae bacterium 1502E]|nr:histone deacetylase family protein [Geminicoccaceae bacterium 1502E]